MSVKVLVKGQDMDFELFGATAREGRIFDTEILEVFDADNVILYAIPFENVKYIQMGVTGVTIPRSVGNQRRTLVYVVGDNDGDLMIDAQQFKFNRAYNQPYMELFSVNERNELSLDFVVPLKQIRYIDYNAPIPMQQNEGTTNESASSGVTRPNFKQRPRSK